jgi:hypothetical protein
MPTVNHGVNEWDDILYLHYSDTTVDRTGIFHELEVTVS